MELAERVRELETVLIRIQREVQGARIWGGMGWRWNDLPRFRAERIDALCEDALDSIRPEPSNEGVR